MKGKNAIKLIKSKPMSSISLICQKELLPVNSCDHREMIANLNIVILLEEKYPFEKDLN